MEVITTLWRNGLILWTSVALVGMFEQFHCMGDHGQYCPISFEREFPI